MLDSKFMKVACIQLQFKTYFTFSAIRENFASKCFRQEYKDSNPRGGFDRNRVDKFSSKLFFKIVFLFSSIFWMNSLHDSALLTICNVLWMLMLNFFRVNQGYVFNGFYKLIKLSSIRKKQELKLWSRDMQSQDVSVGKYPLAYIALNELIFFRKDTRSRIFAA